MTEMTSSALNNLPADWPDELVALLDRQRSICLELKSLARRQPELIRGDRAEDLLRLLASRQTLIDELTSLAASLNPYREQWAELWPRLDAARQARVNRSIEDAQAVVDSIVESDRTDHERLRDEQRRVQDQLGALSTARTSNRAYSRTSTPGGVRRNNRFMDEQG